MKFDITKRLREPPFGTETSERLLMAEAADAIDGLRVENERLRFMRRDLSEELLALLTQISEADDVTDYAREERIADLQAALALSEAQP